MRVIQDSLAEVDLDGSAGQNALAIPEATAHFDVSRWPSWTWAVSVCA